MSVINIGEPLIVRDAKTGLRYTARFENGNMILSPVDGQGKELHFKDAWWSDDGTDDETDENGNVTLTFG